LRKSSRKKMHGVKGAMLALCISLLICVTGILLIAELMLDQKVREEGIRIIIPALIMIASVIGGQVNCIVQEKWVPYMPLEPIVALAVLLLIGGFLFDGTFEMLGCNLIGIGISALISCVICMKKTRKCGLRKTAYR